MRCSGTASCAIWILTVKNFVIVIVIEYESICNTIITYLKFWNAFKSVLLSLSYQPKTFPKNSRSDVFCYKPTLHYSGIWVPSSETYDSQMGLRVIFVWIVALVQSWTPNPIICLSKNAGPPNPDATPLPIWNSIPINTFNLTVSRY